MHRSAQRGIDVVGVAGDAVQLLALVSDERPDAAIVDIRMPPSHTTEGIDAAMQIRAEHPGVAVLLLSQHVEAHQAVDLLGGGAAGIGYLLKDRVLDPAEVIDALERLVGAGP